MSEQTTRRIAELDAVSRWAGVGLTTDEADTVLAAVRSNTYAIARVADVISPWWRSSPLEPRDHDAQTIAIERAARVVESVRQHDLMWAEL